MKQAIQELVALYQNNLFAVAFNVCKNAQDAEDIVQDTFLQYYTMQKEFDSEQHIRAWLIRVAINKAKNANRAFWRCNKLSLEDYMETLTFETPQSENLFETVMKLPEKYRIPKSVNPASHFQSRSQYLCCFVGHLHISSI